MDSLLSRLQHALGDRYRIEREVGRGGTGVPWDEQEPEWLPPTEIGRFAINDWSPDGRRLAGHIDYRDTGILTYTFATRTYRRFTDYGQWPVWLPGSRRILFVSGGSGFHLLDTETGDVTRIYSSPSISSARRT
jgi:hypothetical protein